MFGNTPKKNAKKMTAKESVKNEEDYQLLWNSCKTELSSERIRSEYLQKRVDELTSNSKENSAVNLLELMRENDVKSREIEKLLEKLKESEELKFGYEMEVEVEKKRRSEFEEQLKLKLKDESHMKIEAEKALVEAQTAMKFVSESEKLLSELRSELSGKESDLKKMQSELQERLKLEHELNLKLKKIGEENEQMKSLIKQFERVVQQMDSEKKEQLEKLNACEKLSQNRLMMLNKEKECVRALSTELSKSKLCEKGLEKREEEARKECTKLREQIGKMLRKEAEIEAKRKALDEAEKNHLASVSKKREEYVMMEKLVREATQHEKDARAEVVNVRKENVDLHANLLSARRENVDSKTRAALQTKSFEADAARRMADALSAKLATYETAIAAVFRDQSNTKAVAMPMNASQNALQMRGVRERLWNAAASHAWVEIKQDSSSASSSSSSSAKSKAAVPSKASTDDASSSSVATVAEIKIDAQDLARDFSRAERALANARSTHAKLSASAATTSVTPNSTPTASSPIKLGPSSSSASNARQSQQLSQQLSQVQLSQKLSQLQQSQKQQQHSLLQSIASEPSHQSASLQQQQNPPSPSLAPQGHYNSTSSNVSSGTATPVNFDRDDGNVTLALISNSIDQRAQLQCELDEIKHQLVHHQYLLELRTESEAELMATVESKSRELVRLQTALDSALWKLLAKEYALEALEQNLSGGQESNEESKTIHLLKMIEKFNSQALAESETLRAAKHVAQSPPGSTISDDSRSGRIHDEIEVEMLTLKEELKAAKETVQQRGELLDILRDQLEERERDVDTQREALGEGQSRIEQVNQQLSGVQKALDSEERKSLQLQQSLNSSRAENEALVDRIMAKDSEMKEVEEKLKKETQTLKESQFLVAELRRDIESLEVELKQAQLTKKADEEMLSKLRRDLKDEQKSRREIGKRHNQAVQEIARLEGLLSDANASIDALEKKEDELRDAISRQQAALFELHERLKFTETLSAKSDERADSIEAERVQLARQLDELRSQLSRTESLVESSKQELESSRNQLAHKTDQVSTLELELEQQKTALFELQSQVAAGTKSLQLKESVILEHTLLARSLSLKQTERIELLSQTINQQNRTISDLEKKLEAVTHQASVQATDIKILREELEALEFTLGETEDELRKCEARVVVVEKERDAKESALFETQAQLRKVGLNLEDTQSALEQTRDSYSGLMGDMQELNAHAKEWHKELNNAKDALKDAMREIKSRDGKIYTLERNVESLQENLVNAEKVRDLLNDEKAKVEVELKETREVLEKRVQQLRDRKESMEQLEDQLLKSQRQISELDSNLKLVEAQRNARDQHLRTMKSSNASLVDEYSNVKRRLLEAETHLIELETEHAFCIKRGASLQSNSDEKASKKSPSTNPTALSKKVSTVVLGRRSLSVAGPSGNVIKNNPKLSTETAGDLKEVWIKKLEAFEEHEKAFLEAQSEIARLESENSELHSMAKVKQSELNHAIEKLTKLEADVRELEKYAGGVGEDESGEKMRLDQWAACVDGKLRNAEALAFEKEEMLRKEQIVVRELERNVDSLKSEIRLAESERQKQELRMKEEIEELMSNVEKLKVEAEKEKLHCESQILSSESEKEQLRILNEKVQVEYEECRKRLNEIEHELHKAEDEKSELSAKIQRLESDLEHANSKLLSAASGTSDPKVLRDSSATESGKTESTTNKSSQSSRSAHDLASLKVQQSRSVQEMERRIKQLETELLRNVNLLELSEKRIAELEPEAKRSRLATRAMTEMTKKLREMEKDTLQRLAQSEAELRIRAQQIKLLEEECARARANYITIRDRIFQYAKFENEDHTKSITSLDFTSRDSHTVSQQTENQEQDINEAQDDKKKKMKTVLEVIEHELKSASGESSALARDAFVAVRFTLSNVRGFVERRETVHIVGSDTVLGNWNLTASPAMKVVRSTGSDVVLCAEVLMPRAVANLEYKYAVECQDSTFMWESGSNRCFDLTDAPSSIEARDVWHG